MNLILNPVQDMHNFHTTFARSQKFKNQAKVNQKSKSLQKVFEKVLYTMQL